MAYKTSVQWTNSTFNPWRGCAKVSPGCQHCYAERDATRFPDAMGIWGANGTRVLAALSTWRHPKNWNAKCKAGHLVFCASFADIFEDWQGQMSDHLRRPLWRPKGYPDQVYPVSELTQPEGYEPYTLTHARRRLWEVIRQTPNLIWQLLTKRPENIARMMPDGCWRNVWLGTSVESQGYTQRIDALLDTPQEVPVRFVSAEPLLGSLLIPHKQLRRLQWIIVGGESGPHARPFCLDWAVDLIEECRANDVAVFLKQLGANPHESSDDGHSALSLPLVDSRKGGDLNEWPEHLRVREMPKVYRERVSA